MKIMELQELIGYFEAKMFKLNLFESLPINRLSSQYYVEVLREVVSLVNPVQEKKFILADEKITRIK